jgi:hypothetical protein
MSDFRDEEKLLNEVLGEESPAGFREALLNQLLRGARRRRRFRQVRKAGVGLALVALVAVVVWRQVPPASRPEEPRKGCELVQTEALPEDAIVRTRALAPNGLVASVPTRDTVITRAGTTDGVEELTDDELLALAGPGAAVLVRQGPHSAELVFVNRAPPEVPQE